MTLKPTRPEGERCADDVVVGVDAIQALHQFTGSAKLPLAEGTYQVVARGPANLPTSETPELKAGNTPIVDLRNVASGME